MKFKIGDRVVIDSKFANPKYLDRAATVEEIRGGVYILGNIEGENNPNIKQFISSDDELVLLESAPELPELPEIKVGFIILPNSITLQYGGTMKSIAKGDYRYNEVIKAINENRLSEIPDLLDPSKIFSGEDGIELVDGVIEVDGRKVPEGITDQVLKFREQGLPYQPLINFSKKVMKNPSFNSRNMLFKFLEHNGHPFTQDGNFIAYKAVRENFKDVHTGRMDNSVGTVVEMDRSEVDDNPDNTCSSGLHVASYEYAKDFHQGHLLAIEINPEDVVAVPNDYNGQKMRVCKYKVLDICESKFDDGIYDEDEFYED